MSRSLAPLCCGVIAAISVAGCDGAPAAQETPQAAQEAPQAAAPSCQELQERYGEYLRTSTEVCNGPDVMVHWILTSLIDDQYVLRTDKRFTEAPGDLAAFAADTDVYQPIFTVEGYGQGRIARGLDCVNPPRSRGYFMEVHIGDMRGGLERDAAVHFVRLYNQALLRRPGFPPEWTCEPSPWSFLSIIDDPLAPDPLDPGFHGADVDTRRLKRALASPGFTRAWLAAGGDPHLRLQDDSAGEASLLDSLIGAPRGYAERLREVRPYHREWVEHWEAGYFAPDERIQTMSSHAADWSDPYVGTCESLEALLEAGVAPVMHSDAELEAARGQCGQPLDDVVAETADLKARAQAVLDRYGD